MNGYKMVLNEFKVYTPEMSDPDAISCRIISHCYGIEEMDAFAAAKGWGGIIAPMHFVLYAQCRGKCIGGATNSEEISGYGEFRGKKDYYVITIHGGINEESMVIDSSVILNIFRKIEEEKGYSCDGTSDGNISSSFSEKDVVGHILNGTMPDGSNIPVFSYEELILGRTPLATCL